MLRMAIHLGPREDGTIPLDCVFLILPYHSTIALPHFTASVVCNVCYAEDVLTLIVCELTGSGGKDHHFLRLHFTIVLLMPFFKLLRHFVDWLNTCFCIVHG